MAIFPLRKSWHLILRSCHCRPPKPKSVAFSLTVLLRACKAHVACLGSSEFYSHQMLPQNSRSQSYANYSRPLPHATHSHNWRKAPKPKSVSFLFLLPKFYSHQIPFTLLSLWLDYYLLLTWPCDVVRISEVSQPKLPLIMIYIHCLLPVLSLQTCISSDASGTVTFKISLLGKKRCM